MQIFLSIIINYDNLHVIDSKVKVHKAQRWKELLILLYIHTYNHM